MWKTSALLPLVMQMNADCFASILCESVKFAAKIFGNLC